MTERQPDGSAALKRLRTDPDGLGARRYVLLVSGTMNPPHRGHALLGLHAAKHLQSRGHEVTAVCYLPVHDNYLHNKIVARGDGNEDDMCYPMDVRCSMLQSLIKAEGPEAEALCHVLDYEHAHADELLQESPGYWAPKMRQGYLKTAPTTGLIQHFALHSEFMTKGGSEKRLGTVFGIDNLPFMATWNSPEKLLANTDLIIVGRDQMDLVTFSADPSSLLAAVKYFDLLIPVPVQYGGVVLFGSAAGKFTQENASGKAALVLLPALEGEVTTLSSTQVRDSVNQCLQTLERHGFSGSAAVPLLAGAAEGKVELLRMHERALKRGEFVQPEKS